MMHRIQVSLEPELQRRARGRAAELGVSLAEYLRRLLARDLGEPPPSADPTLVFALGSSTGADIARHKDAMVAEALDDEHRLESSGQ